MAASALVGGVRLVGLERLTVVVQEPAAKVLAAMATATYLSGGVYRIASLPSA